MIVFPFGIVPTSINAGIYSAQNIAGQRITYQKRFAFVHVGNVSETIVEKLLFRFRKAYFFRNETLFKVLFQTASRHSAVLNGQHAVGYNVQPTHFLQTLQNLLGKRHHVKTVVKILFVQMTNTSVKRQLQLFKSKGETVDKYFVTGDFFLFVALPLFHVVLAVHLQGVLVKGQIALQKSPLQSLTFRTVEIQNGVVGVKK